MITSRIQTEMPIKDEPVEFCRCSNTRSRCAAPPLVGAPSAPTEIMPQRDNADTPARQYRQCRCASATIPPMPKRQRGDVDAQAQKRRGTSATMPRNQRDNDGAPAWRFRVAIVAPSALGREVGTNSLRRWNLSLYVAGCSCLTRLSSAQHV